MWYFSLKIEMIWMTAVDFFNSGIEEKMNVQTGTLDAE